jgi:hypothetical protein
MSARVGRRKRGRPPKFGRPGKVVAITLPEEVVSGLRKLHSDLAWAIVTLFNKTASAAALKRPRRNEAELVAVGGTRALIVVPRRLFTELNLPGVNILPLHDDRAFLALQPGRGMSDLELTVRDVLTSSAIGRRKAVALRRLLTKLRAWRRDTTLRCEARAIIVLERIRTRLPPESPRRKLALPR